MKLTRKEKYFLLAKFFLGLAYVALLVLDLKVLETDQTKSYHNFGGAFIAAVVERGLEAVFCYAFFAWCKYHMLFFTFATASWCLFMCCVVMPPLFFFLPVVFVVALDYFYIVFAIKFLIISPRLAKGQNNLEESSSEKSSAEEELPSYSP